MNFEAGKEYTTREGLRALVYAVKAGGPNPIHGAIWRCGVWSLTSWTEDGFFIDHTYPNQFDLMPPKLTKTKYMFLYADGKVGISEYPSVYSSGCEVVGTAVVELVEGNFGFDLPLAGVKG